ncbi:MAG TPA: HD domain-containing phosphohydrolase, partial [Gemmatimonadota bacterium]|nr:HD domain-containing phosphohydrolase [Gemmatimonadota bacterium]
VSVLSLGLAERVGYGRDDVRAVGKAALLHDVGKTLVPEEILKKPGTLTPEEWTLIKRHPIDGARILFRSRDGLSVAAVVAYEHHMTWDGGGYPERRFPREIHPASALVQVCDVYDALRTRRPFRGPWPEDRVLAHLRAGAGEAFSSEMVSVFLAMMDGLREESEAD